jgi:hypothetical protein
MRRVSPDVYLRIWREQAVGGGHGGRGHDTILVHLMQVNVVRVGAEQLLTNGRENDLRVAQLPFARRLDLAA